MQIVKNPFVFIGMVAISAALLLSNAAANAADLYVPVTPEPIYEAAGFDWNGLYVGVHGGGEQYRLASFDRLLSRACSQ